MAETYCGKSCGTCAYREKLGCPGCKNGPGNISSGECELSKCCTDKGHENCDTCTYSTSCGTRRRREFTAEYRLSKLTEDAEIKAKISQKAPVVSRCFLGLFWLSILVIVSGIISSKNITEWLPQLHMPFNILNFLCLFAYSFILVKLSGENSCYRISGICCFIIAVINMFTDYIFSGDTASWELLPIMLIILAIELVGDYQEYTGHSEFLEDIDSYMSEKWSSLWKWYIRIVCSLAGCIIIALISSILGLSVMLVALIGFVVVKILKIIYLYRSAKLFKAYTQPETHN